MDRIEIREDTDSRFPWSTVETTFSLVGDQSVLTSTKIIYDTGITRTDEVRLEDSLFGVGPDTFTNDPQPIPQDVVRYRIWEDADLNGGEDLKPWTSIVDRTITFGDSLLTEDGLVTNTGRIGETTERTITYDNGNETFFYFRNDILTSKTIFDGSVTDVVTPPGAGQGSKSWFAVTFQYDIDGTLTRSGVFFDNGITQDDQFTDGVLTSRTLTDAFYLGGDGIKPWAGILTNFDPTGTITFERTVFDDGRWFEEFYTDGVLSQTILTIPEPAPSQCSFDPNCVPEPVPVQIVGRVTDFDANGERNQQVTTYSDDDVTGFIFVDGAITERQFYDGDGDADWVVARILFENGQRTDVILYDSLDLVPDEVIVVPEDISTGTAPGPETFS